MRAQGIATQGVFMQKVPYTFVGVTPFSLVLSCLLFIPNKSYNGKIKNFSDLGCIFPHLAAMGKGRKRDMQ